MPDNTQTPDMQAAGVQQPPESLSMPSLMDALRSRGTLPAGLSAQMQGPSGGLAIGSGVLNTLSGGNAAQNPYLQGQQQQVNQQFWQQQQVRQQVIRQQEREQERQERREEAYYKIVDGLKESSDPSAREMYGREMSKLSTKLGGAPIPPEYFKQATKLSQSEQDFINQDIVAGLQGPQIVARNPKVATLGPEWLRAQMQVMQNPAIRKRMGIATDEELAADRSKRVRDESVAQLDTWRAQNPDVGASELPWLAKFVTQQTGLPLVALDPSNPEHQRIKTEGLKAARDQIRKNEIGWEQLAETRRHNLAVEARQAEEMRLKGEGGALGKPLSAEATQQITGAVRLGRAVENIDAIRDDPKKKKIVDGYIGPLASRLVQAQQVVPGGFMVGKTPGDMVDLQQNIATLKNYTIKLITGAALSEPEARRIITELPTIELPPDQFWRKYETARQNVQTLKKITNAAIVKGDRRALSVMQELESGPVGTPLNPVPRRIKVRDNKTGKTHWAELGAGDMIPPGYTEIK